MLEDIRQHRDIGCKVAPNLKLQMYMLRASQAASESMRVHPARASFLEDQNL